MDRTSIFLYIITTRWYNGKKNIYRKVVFENIPSSQQRTPPAQPLPNANASPFGAKPPAQPMNAPSNIITEQIQNNPPEGATILDIDTHESSINRRNILLVVGVLLVVLIGLTVGGFFIVQRLASDSDIQSTSVPVIPAVTNKILTTNTNQSGVTTPSTSTIDTNTPTINTAPTNTPAPSGVCIYQDQVVADPAADADADGLLDGQESVYGTSMYLADTDGDSYFDGQEVKGGYNPCGAGKLP